MYVNKAGWYSLVLLPKDATPFNFVDKTFANTKPQNSHPRKFPAICIISSAAAAASVIAATQRDWSNLYIRHRMFLDNRTMS